MNQYTLPTFHHPSKIDEMLAIGWFRMGQSMFTNRYVIFHDHVYRTVWLRNYLSNYTRSKTFTTLLKRNKNFEISFEKLNITHQHNALYAKYKNAMPFDISESIENLLFCFAQQKEDVFNTYQINLHDGEKLIACSYLDFGLKSAQGISAFYDSDYATHSLGKYMIYLQLDICFANKMDFFYPGYFVPFYSHLDYKLGICTNILEYYDYDSDIWLPIENYQTEAVPIEVRLLMMQ